MELLASLDEAGDLFERIVVSFNGDQAEEDEHKLNRSLVGSFKNLIIIRTRKSLPAIRHMSFFVDYLKRNFPSDSPIFLLAHDDVLLTGNLRGFLAAKGDFKGGCTLGDWMIFSDAEHKDVRLGTAFPPGVSEMTAVDFIQWQTATSSNSIFTNMSGMIVSLCALAKVAWVYNLPLEGYGARFEYCLATSRYHSKLLRADPPLVKIREHPGQEGKNVPVAAYG